MRRVHRRPCRCVPELGGLEGRALLSTFTVTNLADSGAGSLRTAVALSNLTPGADTIRFAPALTGEIHLTSGALTLTDGVNIVGPGASRIAVTGNTDRIFDVAGTTATISGLTLQDGVANTGGALLNEGGNLVTREDNFVGDTATLAGGAVFNFAGTYSSQYDTFISNSAPLGGAVANTGRMTMRDDTFVANGAAFDGGAVLNARFFDTLLPEPTATITDSTFTANTAMWGGAVGNQNHAAITLDQDRFTGNTATQDGGAFFNGWKPGEGDSATVTRSTFTGNTAGVQGGALNSNANLVLAQSTLQFNSAPTGGAVWAINGTFTPIADTIQFNTAPQVFLA